MGMGMFKSSGQIRGRDVRTVMVIKTYCVYIVWAACRK